MKIHTLTKRMTVTCFALASMFAMSAYGQKSTKDDSETQLISQKKEFVIELKNIDKLEKLLERKEANPITTYGTIVVAIAAVIGTVATSIITNRRSRINTESQLASSMQNTALQLTASKEAMEKQVQNNRENVLSQLNASEQNLKAQIAANKLQDVEKRNAELQFKLKNDLKENVAKFIKLATQLNLKLNVIILYDYEEGRTQEAEEKYEQTHGLRNELMDCHYSIKVTLDGSDKQRALERVIDSYMKITCIEFDLPNTNPSDYRPLIPLLFHKIKTIIHDNYQEPTE